MYKTMYYLDEFLLEWGHLPQMLYPGSAPGNRTIHDNTTFSKACCSYYCYLHAHALMMQTMNKYLYIWEPFPLLM